MADEQISPRSKRRFYVIAFVIAFGIDLIAGLMEGRIYHPSLVGLAVMITAALFFTYSLIRDR